MINPGRPEIWFFLGKTHASGPSRPLSGNTPIFLWKIIAHNHSLFQVLEAAGCAEKEIRPESEKKNLKIDR